MCLQNTAASTVIYSTACIGRMMAALVWKWLYKKNQFELMRFQFAKYFVLLFLKLGVSMAGNAVVKQ